MCCSLFDDPGLYHFLFVVDKELANRVRTADCPRRIPTPSFDRARASSGTIEHLQSGAGA